MTKTFGAEVSGFCQNTTAHGFAKIHNSQSNRNKVSVFIFFQIPTKARATLDVSLCKGVPLSQLPLKLGPFLPESFSFCYLNETKEYVSLIIGLDKDNGSVLHVVIRLLYI